MGIQIYEGGHKAANKSTGSGMYAISEKKSAFAWNVNGNTDISQLRSLLGRELKIKVPVDTHDIEKKGWIIKLYPHCAKVAYEVGREGYTQHTLYTCLSTAELIEMGIITFKTGRPEVIA